MGETTVRHPLFARLYARCSVAAEAAGNEQHRRELLAGLAGRVIEIGAGNGLNFGYYPPSVTEVVAVEPEAYLRTKAVEAATKAQVHVTVVDGTAEHVPAESAEFDAAVASLVLCSVHDQHAALRELHRVLRPGGELRYFEHVQARTRTLRRAQQVADRTFWPRVAGGCHAARDTHAAIVEAGFDIDEERRFPFKPCALAVLTAPHLIGRAHRRATK